ncbi:MAG TPA: nodulation protein NfeD [Opitutaceae bacterium]|nr:nodulation protein NfeD [Opitutaceae bacterium]
MRSWICLIAVGFICCATGLAQDTTTAAFIRIDGAIGPATAGYVSRATKVAEESHAECLVIELDTPGGLLDSTKAIVQAFYASRVPVVVYVAPSGANAGSAGCFITLAADIAAMAPNTSIGAAHPVEMGGAGVAEQKTDDVMTKKLENFAASYIEAIADKRHRNVEWARSAVKESASITAEKALDLKVIDLIAVDVPDLLRRIDGRRIGDRVLHTAGAKIVPVPMLARERVFQLLWRPEVLFVLMLIAIYGIVGELSNPGAILPGVAGGIALILALYMGSVLPISIAGVSLILLAVALFVIDVFAPTHGVLTAGGVVAFFLGALLLFEGAGPGFQLSLTAIIPATLVTAAFFMFVIGAGLRAQRLPIRAGRETMLGRVVPAATRIDAGTGRIFVEGEYWNARCEQPIEPGQPVEIVAISGLTLTVKPKT